MLTPHFTAGPYTSTSGSDVMKQTHMAYERLEDQMSNFTQLASGWILERNNNMVLQMVKYAPLKGNSYLQLHPSIADKKAIINVKNKDDHSFKWAILSALDPVEIHPERVNNYKPFEEELNFSGLTLPMKINNISQFEEQNPSISVSVIGYEVKGPRKKRKVDLFLLRMMEEKKEHHLTLLHWSDGNTGHYAWVKSL